MPQKIIRLTEDDLHNIINKCVNRYLIKEDREGKNMKMARNIVRQYQPKSDAMEVITAIREQVPNSRLLDCKYLPGVTKMFMDGRVSDISKLNDTIGKIAQGHSNEYDSMLNNESPDTLINRFAGELQADFDKDVAEHNNTQFTENSDYKIVRIDSARDAWYYNQFTDWCITSPEPSENYDGDEDEDDFDPEEHDGETCGDDMYNTYTHNKLGVFYFCLKDGFEKVPNQKGENCPLDEYGLSMIATSVDDKGKCQTITCRWNHSNNGNDHVMTPMQLSQIIGRNYYQTFLPRTKEELEELGLIPFDEALKEIRNGRNPKEIFRNIEQSGIEGIWIVTLNGLKNYYDVNKNEYFNIPWLYNISQFHDNLALVNDFNSGLNNYIKPDGTFLFDKNVDFKLREFNDGYALISKSTPETGILYYILDSNGNIINQENPIQGLVKSVKPYVNGLLAVERFDGILIFDTDGNLISEGKFKSIGDFNQYGLAKCVLTDGKEAIVNKEGNFLFNKTFAHVSILNMGMTLTDDERNGYICHLNGEPVMNQKFGDVWGIDKKGITTRIKLNGRYNYIDMNTDSYVSEIWFDNCDTWLGKGTKVSVKGKWNILDENGNTISKEWYDSIKPWSLNNPPYIIGLDGKYTVLFEDGSKLNQLFDSIEDSKAYGRKIAKIGDKEYIIDIKNHTFLPYTTEQKNIDAQRVEDERKERYEEMRDDW